jgi:hypothetical protein
MAREFVYGPNGSNVGVVLLAQGKKSRDKRRSCEIKESGWSAVVLDECKPLQNGLRFARTWKKEVGALHERLSYQRLGFKGIRCTPTSIEKAAKIPSRVALASEHPAAIEVPQFLLRRSP